MLLRAARRFVGVVRPGQSLLARAPSSGLAMQKVGRQAGGRLQSTFASRLPALREQALMGGGQARIDDRHSKGIYTRRDWVGVCLRFCIRDMCNGVFVCVGDRP